MSQDLSDDALIESGRAALAAGAWEEARARFTAALAQAERPEALEGLGLAAWWLDDGATTLDARERAYRAYRERDDALGAARMAIWLTWDFLSFRGEFAVASGWLERARRLLEGRERTAEFGWLLVREGEIEIFRRHDPRAAQDLARRAAELGRALGDAGVEMNALALEGLALVTEGRVEVGMRRLDEATAAATAGEVKELHAVGVVCCWQMFACERVRDYERAAQWCHRVKEFAKRWRNVPLSGVCRSQYAGVLIWRGNWAEAEAELSGAAGDLGATKPAMVGQALARLGELRLRQGRLDEAARLFDQGGTYPSASLGVATLMLEEGDARGAAAEVERLLRQLRPEDATGRAALVELGVRSRAALGDADEAEAHLAELERIAAEVGTDPLRASAAAARGVLAAARGDHRAAGRSLEESADLYRKSGAPYEEGRTRLELAAALARTGERDRARREADDAARALRRLGAERAAEQGEVLVRELERPAPRREPGPLTRRQLEILRLVAQGASNAAIARRLSLSEHTVKRHVANLLTRLGLKTRAAAAAHAAKLGLL
ncbi:MAG TPA: LuxR C-terminal-related transcriptional regulator [Gemmatimonadales bacterium]|nr:LuxR C-terminal-related transcriptional regulator [Gemmatimonadales bacterium]